MESGKILYSAGGNDECYTPAYAVRPLLQYLEPFRGKIIWCPFDLYFSEFVKVLTAAGHRVVYSSILIGEDFYTYEPEAWDIIISNPPFSRKREIFERALSFGKPFALLMTNTWMNDAAPKQLFKEVPLQLLMFEKRIEYAGSAGKITFSSSYYCRDFLPGQIVMGDMVKE